MKTLLTKMGKAFLHLAYPPLCYSCENGISNGEGLLCVECLRLLELIDPQERCPYCFSGQFCLEQRTCPDCANKKPLFTQMAAAFDYIGPAASLLKKFKYANKPHLAQGLAAYLTVQFLQLDWPMPDFIIPVPTTRAHQWIRGYHQTLLLAEHVSKGIQRPILEALTRKSGDFSQAGLSRDQRIRLAGESIQLKPGQNLRNKHLLIIDDVFTTGTTMRRCAEVLAESCPSSIHVLTVCRAI